MMSILAHSFREIPTLEDETCLRLHCNKHSAESRGRRKDTSFSVEVHRSPLNL